MYGRKGADLNGTYLTCFGCPYFLISALADRSGLKEKGTEGKGDRFIFTALISAPGSEGVQLSYR